MSALMKRVASVVSVVVVLASGGLVACTGTTNGTANPSSVSADPSGTGTEDPAVPKVAQPLDASAYVSDPCKLMPAETLAELKFTDPGKSHTEAAADTAAGPYCGWQIRGGGQGLQVSLLTGNRDKGSGGLKAVYAAKDAGRYAFLDRAPDADGYPAVYADARDRRPTGNCTLFVGIADDLVFGVASTGYEGEQDSCGAAQQAAAAVVKTLKGA